MIVALPAETAAGEKRVALLFGDARKQIDGRSGVMSRAASFNYGDGQ